MKRAIVTVFLMAAAFGGGLWFARRGPAPATATRRVLYYVDPMHPAYRSDKPGIAPDCGMKLVAVYEGQAAPEAASAKILYYRDPQAPDYRSDRPGINPQTGNDLEPVHENTPPKGAIQISPEKQQLIGVKYATAEFAAGVETLRAAGRAAADETRITRVHPRIEGWIQKVHADFTGQYVNKGDPLLTLYSPEMLATEQEYLLALRARDAMKSGPSHDAYENSELLILAARRRLELFDLSDAQVAEIERTRKPVQTITLYSPASGFVASRNAFPSQRVTPETELYAITDLSRIWILADVFEADLAKIQTGMSATVTPAGGGAPFAAKVAYIQPQVDPATRTLKIRLEAQNPKLALKPDQFATVEFRIALAGRVTVPADAVVNTGLRRTVFVDLGNGALEPRQVETGEQTGGRVQILSGLRAGERVAASGAFLIDSEAQLKAGAK